MGGIGMIGTKAVYNAVMHCDLLLMLGTDYPYSEFLPRKGCGHPGRRKAARRSDGARRPRSASSARCGRR